MKVDKNKYYMGIDSYPESFKDYKKRRLLNPKDFTDEEIQKAHELEQKLLKELTNGK